MPTPRVFVRSLRLMLCVAGLSACGGSDATSPSTPALTPQEAKTVAVAIFAEIDRALGDSVAFSASRIPSAARSLASMPTFTMSINSACMKGGTLAGTVTFADNTNAAGTGTVTETMAIAPRGCIVSTGTRNIAVSGQVNSSLSASFTNNEPASDLVTQTTGTLTWNGGSCDLNYGVRYTVQGVVTLTGTVCGQPVDGSVGL